MHLLYLDDSGSVANQNEAFLVLGGLSLFEAQAHWFTQQLDALAETIDPHDPQSVEFHASETFSGRAEPWRSMTRDERRGVIRRILEIIRDSYETARVFACAVHKGSFPERDPMEMAFEDLCSRFDLYLGRLQATGDRQRGLIILDTSSYETSLQALARDFRLLGTRWGRIVRNLADTPVFVNSQASRLVQLADHVAYAVFRRYEASDTSYFDIISSKFDEEGGRLHGLSHRQKGDQTCMCPACLSRRLTESIGRLEKEPQ
jgi:hypothetical protein